MVRSLTEHSSTWQDDDDDDDDNDNDNDNNNDNNQFSTMWKEAILLH